MFKSEIICIDQLDVDRNVFHSTRNNLALNLIFTKKIWFENKRQKYNQKKLETNKGVNENCDKSCKFT